MIFLYLQIFVTTMYIMFWYFSKLSAVNIVSNEPLRPDGMLYFCDIGFNSSVKYPYMFYMTWTLRGQREAWTPGVILVSTCDRDMQYLHLHRLPNLFATLKQAASTVSDSGINPNPTGHWSLPLSRVELSKVRWHLYLSLFLSLPCTARVFIITKYITL